MSSQSEQVEELLGLFITKQRLFGSMGSANAENYAEAKQELEQLIAREVVKELEALAKASIWTFPRTQHEFVDTCDIYDRIAAIKEQEEK